VAADVTFGAYLCATDDDDESAKEPQLCPACEAGNHVACVNASEDDTDEVKALRAAATLAEVPDSLTYEQLVEEAEALGVTLTPARKAYAKVYNEVMAPPRKAYDEALRLARKAYDKVLARASAPRFPSSGYDKVMEDARKACDEAEASAAEALTLADKALRRGDGVRRRGVRNTSVT
jgi:hypothetical protein